VIKKEQERYTLQKCKNFKFFNCTRVVSLILNFWDGAGLGPMIQQPLMGTLCQSWMKNDYGTLME